MPDTTTRPLTAHLPRPTVHKYTRRHIRGDKKLGSKKARDREQHRMATTFECQLLVSTCLINRTIQSCIFRYMPLRWMIILADQKRMTSETIKTTFWVAPINAFIVCAAK